MAAPARAEALRRYWVRRTYTFLTQITTADGLCINNLKISLKILGTENKNIENEINSIVSTFSPILGHCGKKPKRTVIRSEVEVENKWKRKTTRFRIPAGR